jgi:hypothetical protein
MGMLRGGQGFGEEVFLGMFSFWHCFLSIRRVIRLASNIRGFDDQNLRRGGVQRPVCVDWLWAYAAAQHPFWV